MSPAGSDPRSRHPPPLLLSGFVRVKARGATPDPAQVISYLLPVSLSLSLFFSTQNGPFVSQRNEVIALVGEDVVNLHHLLVSVCLSICFAER